MIKLNGEKAQKAWDDYKQFLLGLGQNVNLELVPKHQVEQAFKMGFAMGEASKPEPQPQPAVITQISPATAIKKKYKRGRIRTPQEVEQDGRLISSILQKAARPMQLQDIITAAQAAGANWNPQSASGYMLKAMDRYPAIKKVGYGIYGYEQ